MLTIQYRMHPSLAHFPSKQFCHGRLTDGVSERERPVPPGIPWPNPGMPLTLIDVPNGKQKGTENSKSLFNMEEAEAAVRAVYMLITSAAGADARPLDTSDVGIVTPYSRQVEEIKKLAQKRLGAATAARLEVRTVDGFQGREKEVILFSCVRAAPLDKNGPHEIGFLSDGRRMNVAITRAKRGLLVLANVRTLRHARSVTPRSMPAAATEEGSLEPTDGARAWRAFVEDAEARGLLLDAAVLPPVPDSACRRTTLSDAADSDDDSHSDGEGGSSSKRGRGHGWMGPGAKRSRHAPW
jgi:superfamily I DNA and/or RNA helicase